MHQLAAHCKLAAHNRKEAKVVYSSRAGMRNCVGGLQDSASQGGPSIRGCGPLGRRRRVATGEGIQVRLLDGRAWEAAWRGGSQRRGGVALTDWSDHVPARIQRNLMGGVGKGGVKQNPPHGRRSERLKQTEQIPSLGRISRLLGSAGARYMYTPNFEVSNVNLLHH